MKKTGELIICLLVFICNLPGFAEQAKPEEKTYRILQINSYSSADPFSQNIDKGIKQYLNDQKVMFHSEEYEIGVRYYLSNKPSPADVEAIRKKLSGKYDLVILCNNAAVDLFLDGTLSLPVDTPVLISSYHGPLALKLTGKANVTGIETRNLWYQNALFAAQIFPNMKHIILIAEAGAAGEEQVRDFQEMLTERKKNMPVPVRLISGKHYSTDEMLGIVAAQPPDTVVLFSSWSSVKDRKLGGGNRVLQYLGSIAPGPVIGKYHYYIRDGAAGGVTNLGYYQGLQAGKMAQLLLSGTQASALPVQQGPIRTVLTHKAVKQFNIPATSIPSGTELVDAPQTALERNFNAALVAGFGCILLLVLWIAYLLKCRLQEKRLAAMLRVASEMARVVTFRWDMEGQAYQTVANPHFWPEQEGRPVPPEMWLLPEFTQAYREMWGRLQRGESDSEQITYAAGTPSAKNWFEMRVRKILNPSGKYEFFGLIQDISEARRDEMRCRDNLALLDSLIDNLPGCFFVKDIDDRYRYIIANRQFADKTGVSQNNIVGSTDEEIFFHSPDLVQLYRNTDEALAKSRNHIELREPLIDRNGKRHEIRSVKSTFSLSNGRRLLIGFGIDITRQFELEQQQKAVIERLDDALKAEKIVNESLARIATASDFHSAVMDMIDVIGRHSGADRCYIYRFTDDALTGAVCEFEWVNNGVRAIRHAQKLLQIPEIPEWKEQLRSETPILISDFDELTPEYRKRARILHDFEIRSFIAESIRIDGKLYGFVGVDYVRSVKNFTDSDIHMLDSVAKLFRLAMERFRK